MKIVSMLMLLLLFLPVVSAQAKETKDPIDAKFDKCLAASAGQTTAGMVNCTGNAITDWDKRMNENYQAALAALGETPRAFLRVSQKQWVNFRSSEQDVEKLIVVENDGSLIRLQVMSNELSAIKERATELLLYSQPQN